MLACRFDLGLNRVSSVLFIYLFTVWCFMEVEDVGWYSTGWVNVRDVLSDLTHFLADVGISNQMLLLF